MTDSSSKPEKNRSSSTSIEDTYRREIAADAAWIRARVGVLRDRADRMERAASNVRATPSDLKAIAESMSALALGIMYIKKPDEKPPPP